MIEEALENRREQIRLLAQTGALSDAPSQNDEESLAEMISLRDRIVVARRIHTLDPKVGTVRAVAVRGGRILAAGATDEVAAVAAVVPELAPRSGLGADGVASDGEVEDYIWNFGPNAVTLSDTGTKSAPIWPALAVGTISLVGVGTVIFVHKRRQVQS